MARSSFVVCLLLSVFACPRPESSVTPDRAATDAGVTVDPELERLRAGVAQLERELSTATRAADEALWAHWTTGAPLDAGVLAARRLLVATPQRLQLLEQASSRGVDDPRALGILESTLRAEALVAQLDVDDVGALEAALTFPAEGKEVRWRDLNRLLATEKSALKRKTLWSASLSAAEKLDAALAQRDAKLAQAVAPERPFDVYAEQRDVEPEAMRRVAEGVLTLTGEAWRLTLERLNAADTKLPVASLTRADLPRLMRVPADVELAFDKKVLAPRAIELLSGLGLYGRPGLTLDLTDTSKKHPLPLTVAPGGPADVRVSVRPLGGLRDQQLLLSELGVALALHHAATGRFVFDRLGDPALAQATGELLALLPLEPAWLESVGVQPQAQQAIVDSVTTQRLFTIRRAAAVYLARLDAVERSDAESKTRAAAIFTRALGVTHTEADLVRLRLDTDDALRSATTLRAMLLAEHLRQTLASTYGPAWFKETAAGEALRELWRAGTSVAAEDRIAPLGDALTAFWQRTVTITPVGQPRDGGVVVGEWPTPRDAPERPMSTARAWPRPIGPTDGGRQVRDWPQMTPRTIERRWVPRPWPQPLERRIERPDAGP
ncbi:MAG: hypothetical protein MUC96_08450 [Myxococcaceae bacterium]|jgi:hypothetical protein|nr:hypothetical protein [Myxococcaceae bacterium]